MNCKTKAIVYGAGWGLGVLAAMAGLAGVLVGLFLLGDAIGVNMAAIISFISFVIIFIGVGKAGYDHYLDNCQEK